MVAVAALLALIANGWVSDRSTRVMVTAIGWVDHTRDVLVCLDRFRAALAEAETNARGFVITGVPDFEADFSRASVRLSHELQTLRSLTADNAHQQAAVGTLAAQVDRRVELLHEVIALKQRKAVPIDIEKNVLRGTMVSRNINETLGDIRGEELLRLEMRRSEADHARTVAIWAPWAMCAIAVFMFGIMLMEVLSALKAERRVQDELQRSIELEQSARLRAEESDRLKDDFLATISHELRTPLTAIVGWSGLLANREVRKDLMEDGVSAIAQAARVQSQLIEDLLDASRASMGRLRLTLGPIDLADIIRNAISAVAPSAEAKEISIRTFLEPSPDGCLGDPERLQQIVWNLLSNAIKFTPKGGRVEVMLRRVNSHVEISVTDNGDGIPPEFLPHVFDRFRQADSGPTRRSGGLGLGLAIVKNLVEMHGGAIRVQSAGIGQGATFVVELPVSAMRQGSGVEPVAVWRSTSAADAAEPIPQTALPPAMLSGRRILLVEDDERTIEMLATMLGHAGAVAEKATTAAVASALLMAGEPFDAIVCDIGLPGEDGLTFMRRLRSMLTPFAGIPAVALTALARPEDRIAALAAGFNSYLAKPVTPQELLFAISSLIRVERDRRARPLEQEQPAN